MNEGGVVTGQPVVAEHNAPPSGGDNHDLAIALDPVLHKQCNGRLGPIEWFSAPWQRGGAATGFSTWRLEDGTTIGVLVKLPVGPLEYRWTTALGRVGEGEWNEARALCLPTPRVVASGTQLNGYDLGWIIVERLHGPTLTTNFTEQAVVDLLAAAADFQKCAMACENLGPRPPTPTWHVTIEHARAAAKVGHLADAQKWNDVLKKVQKCLPTLIAKWEGRNVNAWCHGDLHPGNALRRRLPDGLGPEGRNGCVLVDLALVHPGHWVEDALYLERQYWGHTELLHGVKPLSCLAKFRRERGLPTDESYGDLAVVRRVLMAACAPALVDREGNPKYLHAALEVIERFLPQASR
ncbi:MAG TPA: phosphotransferase [Phycisphaerales bacterium]|nr:phosphotransferase [Phycisphaerales bacterium]